MDSPRSVKKILVVEDNEDLRLVIASTLELEGYLVLQAENGHAAMATLQRATPDLIPRCAPGPPGWRFAD